MTQTRRILRLLVLPAALAFLAACLGAWTPSAFAQTKHTKKTYKHSSRSKKHASGSKRVHTRRTSIRRRRRYHRRRRPRGQRAPTADRISEIQTALAKDGSYLGDPTGKWDTRTIEAMRSFQAAHGLNPSGKLDALSLEKLGLGSETAGIAAPFPPINPNSAGQPAVVKETAERQ